MNQEAARRDEGPQDQPVSTETAPEDIYVLLNQECYREAFEELRWAYANFHKGPMLLLSDVHCALEHLDRAMLMFRTLCSPVRDDDEDVYETVLQLEGASDGQA